MRPKTPKFTDHTDPNSYYNLNKYFNEAEKIFDKLEAMAEPELDDYDLFELPSEDARSRAVIREDGFT